MKEKKLQYGFLIVILSAIPFGNQCQEIPNVIMDHKFYPVMYGDTITINCSVEADPLHTIVYWNKNVSGQVTRLKAGSSGTSGVTVDNPSLTIIYATKRDTGTYICCAVNAIGTGCSMKVEIAVKGEIPTVTIEQQNYLVDYGEKVTLKCKVDSNPSHYVVYWNVTESGEVRRLDSGLPGTYGMAMDNPSLTLNFATMRDEGIYTCCAVNAIGTGYSEQIMVVLNGGLPLVNAKPVNYNILVGTFLDINCTVVALPTANIIYWQRMKDNKIFTINTGTVGTDGITPEYPSLKLSNTSKTDEGIYVCFASNDIGTGKSNEVNITVYGDVPDVNIEHPEYSVNYGDSVIMNCIITATPDINEIYWEKYAHNMKTTIYAGHTGTFGNTLLNPSLMIENVTLEDNAVYRCCARNLVGTGISDSIELKVKGGIPKATVKSPFYKVVYGSRISLHCSVFSIPNASLIYWEKNVTGLITTINYHAMGTDGITVDNPSLTLFHPTHSDSGSYSCVATNVLGTSRSSPTFLTVTGAIPNVDIEMATYITKYGRSVTIRCNVLSTPHHSLVYWEKITDGQTSIVSAHMIGIHGVLPDSPSLTIDYATLSDSAMYTCFAKNFVGIGKSSTSSNLTVIGYIPKVSTEQSTYKAVVGTPVEMSCFAESIPVLNYVYWKRKINGTVSLLIAGMVGFSGMTLDNPSLTVLNPTESLSGEYTCFSSNIIGTGSSSAIVLKVGLSEFTNESNNTTGHTVNSTHVNTDLEYHTDNLLVLGLVTGFGLLFVASVVFALTAIFRKRCRRCWTPRIFRRASRVTEFGMF